MANQLSLFLESRCLLNYFQGAYHHGRSSDHILSYAVDTITQALDRVIQFVRPSLTYLIYLIIIYCCSFFLM